MKLRTLSFAILFALVGCSTESVKDSDNPEVIYNAAVKFIDKERYLDATEHLNEIRHRFPQSRFAALAELRTGDMEFKQENWTEAAAAYKVFVELYPTNPDAAYAQYRRALSYYNDTPDLAARDQSPAKDAIDAADLLVSRYPHSEYVEKAKEIRLKARRKLAEKEAYVARFYRKHDAYVAAYKRWSALLKDFTDLKDDKDSQGLLKEAEKNVSELASKQ